MSAAQQATSALIESSWLWVPVVLFAALAQTVRNSAQRSLTQELGTLSATLVRFLFGLPFAALWLWLLYTVPENKPAIPHMSGAYFAWVALGAFFQVAATAALLLAMKERNFAVAVSLSKTEVLQIALFGVVFLHELPPGWGWIAMGLATLGVFLLSLPPRGQLLSASAWFSKSAIYGLICGACFAFATIGYRGAAVEMNFSSPWISGAWGVLVAQSMQTLGLGAWVHFKTERGLKPLFKAWRISVLAGSMGAAASVAWFTAYSLQAAAPVRTLGMVEVVFSYVVSRKVFSESFSNTERVGMFFMLIGLALICWFGG